MNAVGIDVSKGKSTVTIRRPGDVVLMPPCDIPTTKQGKRHFTAIGAVSMKLTTVIYAVLRDNEPYTQKKFGV